MILIMRRLGLLLLSLLLYSYTWAQEKKISIEAANEPIKNIFSQIQNLSGYNIIYSDEIVLDTMRASVKAENETVSNVLGLILTPQKLYCTWLTNELLIISSSELKDRDSLITFKHISGKVMNEAEQPLPYASVLLSDTNKIVAGTITDETGKYQLQFPFHPDGYVYKIKISSVGYITDTLLLVYPDTVKNIVMKRDKNVMEAVVVSAYKQFIQRLADRYIVNIEGSPLQDGSNALEVLQRTPGVWVDPNGAIHITGGKMVVVMIDNVIKRMTQSDLSDYLKMIKSENISKIEVIPNPPAEYEASGTGGIIHIILKKSKSNGFNGIVSSAYRQQGKQPYYSPGIYFDFRHNKLYAYASSSLTFDKSDYIARGTVTYPDSSQYKSFTNRHNNNKNLLAQAGAVYDITPEQLIGVQGSMSFYKSKQSFLSDMVLYDNEKETLSDAASYRNRKNNFRSATINYLYKLDSIGSEFKIIGDYVHTQNNESNNLTTWYHDPEARFDKRNFTPSVTNNYSAQADLAKEFKNKFKTRTGIKYVATERDNTVTAENLINDSWVTDNKRSNNFVYSENLLMAYATAEKSWKKTSGKIGLRAEKTFMKGTSVTMDTAFNRKYLDFFPSLFLMHYFKNDKKDFLSFSYTKRIKRPQFSDLNPYQLYFDDYTVLKGNPDLIPEYSDNLQLQYGFYKNWTFSLNYSNTKNNIALIDNPANNKILEKQPVNFKNAVYYGASLYAPLAIGKWYTNNFYIEAFRSSYLLPGYKFTQTSVYISSFSLFKLPKKYELRLIQSYRSPYVTGNTQWHSLYVCYIGAYKAFFDNRLKLQLGVDDVFNTFADRYETNYKNTITTLYQKRPTRTLNISVSYNLSSGKIKTKKVEQSNEDEKKRI